jgi:ribonuclease-3
MEEYGKAREVILRLLKQKIDATLSSGEFHDFKPTSGKTQLFGTIPEYLIIRQEGEEHRKVFTAEVYIKGERFGAGFGKSKKEATMAAKQASGKLPKVS